MNSLKQFLFTILIFCLILSSFSLQIQINNIHHGYKTTVQGKSEIISKEGQTSILLTNVNYLMDQLQPELIPFFRKSTKDQISFDLTNQMIQAVFDEDNQVILLVFKQNTSIITTITFKAYSDQPQYLSKISQTIKKVCQWSEEAL